MPRDRDAQLLAWDRRFFGETPSVPLERLLAPLLTDILTAAYFLHLVLPPVLAWLWYRKDRAVFREFLLAVLISAFLGSIGYMIVPAVGPGIAFPKLFERGLQGELYRPITTLLEAARAPRDVFPSLHVGVSSIVLFYGARRSRSLFWILLPLVLLNWLSTLYLRYHYLVDVFAGWIVAAGSIALAGWLLRAEARIREPDAAWS